MEKLELLKCNKQCKDKLFKILYSNIDEFIEVVNDFEVIKNGEKTYRVYKLFIGDKYNFYITQMLYDYLVENEYILKV